jgi:MerR family redox-sensitive transcriptional activator SoxR
VLRRIALIQAGRAAGIPLDQIRAALATLPAHRTPNRSDWERLSRGWREDIDSRIATLEALRNRLTTCIGCGCLSIDACELLNPDDEAAEAGSGAHYLKRDSRSTQSPA